MVLHIRTSCSGNNHEMHFCFDNLYWAEIDNAHDNNNTVDNIVGCVSYQSLLSPIPSGFIANMASDSGRQGES